MTSFDEIIASVSAEDLIKPYEGVSIETMGKPRPDLDNHIMLPDEQRKNLAFFARAAIEHVGWDGFSKEHQEAFKKQVEELYNNISGMAKQSEFMGMVAQKCVPFIEDRHFILATGSAVYSGGGPKEKPSVGKNLGYYKAEQLSDMKLNLIDEEYKLNGKGEKYLAWRICTAQTQKGEDVLIVSIPNLPNSGSYDETAKFIESFDKIYLENKEKWDKGRIIIDVRGNPGGEDKPIDHVAKRLYGNLVNTYKRCEIKDTEVSNAFLHRHGAYKPQNYERDGLKKEDLVARRCFSGTNRALFDETKEFYPYNKEKGYKGRIDILLDSGVGSSAESAYTSFYHHPRVRYIGENTSGMQQFTQGSFAMPCGYMMRIGVTKLTYWDKEGENIEVKGHKPDVNCRGKDALLTAFQLQRDEGRCMGLRQTNEPRSTNVVFAEYNPRATADPRKAYYARYLEPALNRLETENRVLMQQSLQKGNGM